MEPCVGCLGDQHCWVCTGHGVIDVRTSKGGKGVDPCRRCYGSGKCGLCQNISMQDIELPPLIRLERRLRRGTTAPRPEPA
jgi:hypothetical protein